MTREKQGYMARREACQCKAKALLPLLSSEHRKAWPKVETLARGNCWVNCDHDLMAESLRYFREVNQGIGTLLPMRLGSKSARYWLRQPDPGFALYNGILCAVQTRFGPCRSMSAWIEKAVVRTGLSEVRVIDRLATVLERDPKSIHRWKAGEGMDALCRPNGYRKIIETVLGERLSVDEHDPLTAWLFTANLQQIGAVRAAYDRQDARQLERLKAGEARAQRILDEAFEKFCKVMLWSQPTSY